MRDWLKSLRNEKGFLQNDLAERLGVTQGYYAMIESGDRQQKMSVEMAQKLSEALGVPLDYIIKEENKLAQAEQKRIKKTAISGLWLKEVGMMKQRWYNNRWFYVGAACGLIGALITRLLNLICS